MARKSRRRSTRRDPSLSEGTRAVQLNESRRFFSSQGNDQATRQARALQTAIGAGTELIEPLLDKQNIEGASRAAQESATGGERGDDPNKGYMEMWDDIEAGNDIAMMASELPDILNEADWGNLEEVDAQGVIDTYYEKQLKGIDANSVYGRKVAEGIMNQNAELILEHKEIQLEKDKSEKRTMIHTDAMNTLAKDGVFPYDEYARRTNLAFDGPEKMEAWISGLAAAAVEAEDEDIITNAITHFPDTGEPSGVNDPKWIPELEIAKGKARAARARTEEKISAELIAQKEQLRTDGRLDLTELTFAGIDPTVRAIELARNGIIKPEDVTSASSNFRTSRDDRAQHGAVPELVMQMTTMIAVNPDHHLLTPESILGLWGDGGFGPPESPEAQTAARQMMKDVEGGKAREKSLSADPRKSIWTSRFDKTFAPKSNIYGMPVADNMTEIRAEYSSEFKLAVLQASGDKEYRELWEDYSTRYAKQETLVNANESSGSAKGVFTQFRQGNFTVEQAAAKARQLGFNAKSFSDARAAGELGGTFEPGDGSSEDAKYIAILTELRKQL